MITKLERLHALKNQIHRLHRRIDILNQRSNRLSWLRLAIFLSGFLLAILISILAGWPWSLATAFITLVGFSIAAYFHRQVERTLPAQALAADQKRTAGAPTRTGPTFLLAHITSGGSPV